MPVAIVNRGNKGLGLSQSRRFLDAGFEVYVAARTRAEFDRLGGAAR